MVFKKIFEFMYPLYLVGLCFSCSNEAKQPYYPGDVFNQSFFPVGSKNVIYEHWMQHVFFEYNNKNYVVSLSYNETDEELSQIVSGVFYCEKRVFHDDNILLERADGYPPCNKRFTVNYLVEMIGLPSSAYRNPNSDLGGVLIFTSVEKNEYSFAYDSLFLYR